jgi:putative DNA primase/helicase
MTREEIIAANPVVEFVRGRGHDLQRAGKNFVTDGCPLCKHTKRGHRPVTLYTETQSWNCHDCKRGGTVIDWVMLEKNVSAADTMRMLGNERSSERRNNDSTGRPARSLIEKIYDYTDESGKLFFQCVRFLPKRFSQRRPDGLGGWLWNLDGVRRVLYRLPEVLKAQLVCVTEGEKDADNLCDLGFTATTNPGGAGKWRDEYGETLRGKDVVIFSDVDDDVDEKKKAQKREKVRRHVEEIVASLTGIANSIRLAVQPDGFKDISAYVEFLRADSALSGKSVFQLVAELIEQAAPATVTEPETEKSKKEKGKKESAASQLVGFVVDQGRSEQDASGGRRFGPFSLFHDPHDRAFARYRAKDHVEIWPLEAGKFKKILARLYYNNTGKIINRNSLGDAVTTLAGLACHDNPEEPTFLRVAPYGDDVLIDLCDLNWRVVLVTAEGWQIFEQSPVAFVRTGSMQALPEPRAGGGSIEPLWQLLNVTEAQRPLVAGALLNGFHPFGPYFVANYVGEHGSAKSSAARIHRQLIDPNQNPLRSPPKEENDLFAQAVNNRCVALDNLSHLPLWLSDALCRTATGGGLSKRTLYTDTDETSLEIKRPVIINGIEDVATRPDLADRVLQIELDTIPKERRITEKVLLHEFEKTRPVIFTAILDAVSMALRTLPTLKMPPLPRMADAAEWATAGETAFGFERGAFMAAYRQNLDESAIASVEASLVGLAIVKLFEKKETEAKLFPEQEEQADKWQGETSELLEALSLLLTEKECNDKHWPKNPRALGHALRRLAPALRRAGFGLDRAKSNRRILVLTKKCAEGKKTPKTPRSPVYEGKGPSPKERPTSPDTAQHRPDSTQ